MPRRPVVLLAILVAGGLGLLSLAAPRPGAAANPLAPELPPPLGFALDGSHGYRVQVYGVPPQDGTAAEVIVRASPPRRLIWSGAVTYHFPGLVEEGVIQADLGTFGDISVTFHPVLDGGSGTGELDCDRTLSSGNGFYEGTIDFDSAGLTSVDASRAEGDDGLALSIICTTEPGAEQPRPGTYLEVDGGTGGPDLTAALGPPGFTQIEASISETRGGVAIERSIQTTVDQVSHEGLRAATLAPPAPFTGSATFGRKGRRTTWKGNLRIDFPGRPHVKLTGPGIRADLRRLVPAKKS